MSQLHPIEKRLTKVTSDIQLITNDIRTLFKRVESLTVAGIETRKVLDTTIKALMAKINFDKLEDMYANIERLVGTTAALIYVLKRSDPISNSEEILRMESVINAETDESYSQKLDVAKYTRDVWLDRNNVGVTNPDFTTDDYIHNITVFAGLEPERSYIYYLYDPTALAWDEEKQDYEIGAYGELKGITLEIPKSVKNSQVLINPAYQIDTSSTSPYKERKIEPSQDGIDGFINENGIYLGEINAGEYEWETDTEGHNTILKMADGKSAPLYISPTEGLGINYNSASDTYTTVVDEDGLHTNSVNIATNSSTNPVAGLNENGTFAKRLNVNNGTTTIDENGNVITNNLYLGEDVYDPEDESFKPYNALVSITTDGNMKASVVKSSENDPVFNIDADGIIINKSDGKAMIGDNNVLNADGTVICEHIGVKNGTTTTANINGTAGVITATTGVNVTDADSNTIFQLNNADGVIINPQGTNKVSINNTKVDANGEMWTGKITNDQSDETEFTIDGSSITSAKITVGDNTSQSIIEVENDNGKITSSSVKVGNTVEVNDNGITTVNGKTLIIDGTEITTSDITTGSIIDGNVYIGPIEGTHNSNIETNKLICDITTIDENGITVNDTTTSSPYPQNFKCNETYITKTGMTTNSLMCGDGIDPYSYIGPIEGTHTSNIETNDLYIKDVLDITYNGMYIRTSDSLIINENTEITTGSVSTTQINGISSNGISHTLYINEDHSPDGTGIVVDSNGITLQEITTIKDNTVINPDSTNGSISTTHITGIYDSEASDINRPLYINEDHSPDGTGVIIDSNGITLQKETTVNTNTVINDTSISTTQINDISSSGITNTLYINDTHSPDGTGVVIDTDGITLQKETTINTNTVINDTNISTIKISANNASITNNEITADYVLIDNIEINSDGVQMHLNATSDDNNKTITVNGVVLKDVFQDPGHLDTITMNQIQTYNYNAYIKPNEIHANSYVQIGDHMQIDEDGNISSIGDLETLTINGVKLNDINESGTHTYTIEANKVSNHEATITSNNVSANEVIIAEDVKINEDGEIAIINPAETDTEKTLTINGVKLNDINESGTHTYTINANKVSNHEATITSNNVSADKLIINEDLLIDSGEISIIGDVETLTVCGVTLNDNNTINANEVRNNDAYIDGSNVSADTIVIGTTQISSGNITLDNDNDVTVGGITIKSNEIDATSLTYGSTYIGTKTIDDSEVQVLESPKLSVGEAITLDEDGITLGTDATVTLGSNNITVNSTGIVANSLTLMTDGTSTGPGLSLPVFAEVGGVNNVFMYLLDSSNNKYSVYLDISDPGTDPILRVKLLTP